MSMPNLATRFLSAVGVFLLLGLSGCASVHSPEQSYWLTPEPLPVAQRTEVAIARLSEILNRAELTEEQTAQLYYDRAVMFESVGLSSLARFDFMRALRLQPDMAAAYNFMGIHYTLAGNFDQAYEAFDSVLELDPAYDFAYLNRALALYYADRTDLAVDDFSAFHQLNPADPYRAIWLYLAQYEREPIVAMEQLAMHRLEMSADQWAVNIADFLLSHISQAELLSSVAIDLTNPKQLAERLCEAYFYLAKWHSHQQQPERALHFYKLALATNVYEFVEHRYARLEIARLRNEPLSMEHDVF